MRVLSAAITRMSGLSLLGSMEVSVTAAVPTPKTCRFRIIFLHPARFIGPLTTERKDTASLGFCYYSVGNLLRSPKTLNPLLAAFCKVVARPVNGKWYFSVEDLCTGACKISFRKRPALWLVAPLSPQL